jgi:hypothetical protein
MKTHRMTLLSALMLLLAAAPMLAAQAPPKAGATLHLRGTLVDGGVECQAFRAEDGQLYTLTGDLQGFKTGDKVRVTGEVAEISICQQGTTIAVRDIKADKAQGPKDKAEVVKVTGTLTDEGAECQALRAEDGTVYTLKGDLGGFKVGDKVRVTGEVQERSTCLQGTTLLVKKIESAH